MEQVVHIAVTDLLKIELTGEKIEGASFRFSVFELINGTWQYLDNGLTKLSVACSDGQIREMLEKLAATYTDYVFYRQTPVVTSLAGQL